MADLKHLILELVQKNLPDEHHFIVEVGIEEKAGITRLLILLDSDQGITIDSCARISRAISEELEASENIGEPYILEVSSPGLDYPLKTRRQYLKNVGRELKVYLNSGTEWVGRLSAVEDSGLKMSVKKKEKGKKATEEELMVPFEEIKKSIVQVSFK
jgi:ribosome maturation factor RimP